MWGYVDQYESRRLVLRVVEIRYTLVVYVCILGVRVSSCESV